MNILGINAYHGNASAAILSDGKLVAAVEEERFNRVKYAAGFPAAAIRYCLETAGIKVSELDHVAVPRNPYARLATKLYYALQMPSFARERAKVLAKFTGIRQALAAAFDVAPDALKAKFHRVEHHVAHLASTFYCSPFAESALLSADGLGDFASSMWGVGFGRRMNFHGCVAFPHSLGLYYSAVTQYLGFLKFGDEYKVMGLGAYGEPEFLPQFRKIVHANGTRFHLGLEYFTHHRTGPEMSWAEADRTPVLGRMYSDEMPRRLGPVRAPEAPIEQRHKNLACSLQARLEEVYLGMLQRLHQETGLKSVCLAGGVALNSKANGKIVASGMVQNVFVQPAASDDGVALGAALAPYLDANGRLPSRPMRHAYWGPSFDDQTVESALRTYKIRHTKLSDPELVAAQLLSAGKILGWFQGRMEFGPRALGSRSILADPRDP